MEVKKTPHLVTGMWKALGWLFEVAGERWSKGFHLETGDGEAKVDAGDVREGLKI